MNMVIVGSFSAIDVIISVIVRSGLVAYVSRGRRVVVPSLWTAYTFSAMQSR